MTGGQTCDEDGVVDKTFTGKSKFENAQTNSIVSRPATGQSGRCDAEMRRAGSRSRFVGSGVQHRSATGPNRA